MGAESKDEEKTESKDKKFNLPKIKQPKIIKEIRSRSKSRDKKKKKEGDEEVGEASGENKEGEENKEDDGDEKKDLVQEAKSKMKDAMEHLPKMPKIHKPGFMKKKSKESDKADGDKD